MHALGAMSVACFWQLAIVFAVAGLVVWLLFKDDKRFNQQTRSCRCKVHQKP